MSHDHHPSDLPVLPFTDADYAAMKKDDIQAGWDIARLTGGIFTFGLFLYTGVMLWKMFGDSPLYSFR